MPRVNKVFIASDAAADRGAFDPGAWITRVRALTSPSRRSVSRVRILAGSTMDRTSAWRWRPVPVAPTRLAARRSSGLRRATGRVRAGLVTVDHQLQPGSAARAADAPAGRPAPASPPAVLTVRGWLRPNRAAARTARYAALPAPRAGSAPGAARAHSDDQAETVLLASAADRGRLDRGHAAWTTRRGAGRCWTSGATTPIGHATSWASNRGTTRTTPIAATPAPGCAPRCCRCSRMSSAVVSPRRSPAPRPRCARTPRRSTNCAHAARAAHRPARPRHGRSPCHVRTGRRRVIRGWLLAGGQRELTDKQIRGVDTLVTSWRGQGGVAVGSLGGASGCSRPASAC